MEIIEPYEKPYSLLILDYVPERPECFSELSDRAIHSLVREGITNISDLKTALESGTELKAISNFGRKEVAEVEHLLFKAQKTKT